MKEVVQKAVHVLHHFSKAKDYYAEVHAPSSHMASQLKSHLVELHNFRVETQHGSHYLFEKDKGSFSSSLLAGTPSVIDVTVSDIDDCKSLIEIRFGLPTALKTRLYALAAVIGYAHLVFIPSMMSDISPTDFTGRIFWAFWSYLFLISGAILIYLIAMLVPKYRTFTDRILGQIAREALDDCRAKRLAYDENPYRLSVDIKLVLLYMLVTLIPMLHSSLNMPVPYKIIAGILVILALATIILATRALRGSLLHTKIIPLGTNIFLAAAFANVLLFIPISINRVMDDVIRLDLNARAMHGVGIDEMFRNINQYSKVALADTWAWSRSAILSLFAIQFMFFGLGYLILFICSRSIVENLLGGESKHNVNVKRLVDIQASQSDTRHRCNLRLSKPIRGIVWILYGVLTIILWYGLYVNLSMLIAAVCPKSPILHFSYGRTYVLGTSKLLSIFLMGRAHELNRYFIAALISPTLLFFTGFVWRNLFYAAKGLLKYRVMPRAADDILSTVNRIAAQMGVDDVVCLVDKKNPSFSPSSKALGIKPRNLLVFTNRSLDILSGHKEYAEAIIAHEMVHLKGDCQEIRRYRILSRLGFVGVGFLSVLHDSLTMEDRADEAARQYLLENKRNVNTLKEAASLIESYAYWDSKNDPGQAIHSTAFLSSSTSQTTSPVERRRTFWGHFWKASRVAYRFYFDAEIYDYLHREARYR